ncbi:MAG: hypothetical protein WD512_08230, partial [Candidatus Paceibacterota bacterium]
MLKANRIRIIIALLALISIIFFIGLPHTNYFIPSGDLIKKIEQGESWLVPETSPQINQYSETQKFVDGVANFLIPKQLNPNEIVFNVFGEETKTDFSGRDYYFQKLRSIRVHALGLKADLDRPQANYSLFISKKVHRLLNLKGKYRNQKLVLAIAPTGEVYRIKSNAKYWEKKFLKNLSKKQSLFELIYLTNIDLADVNLAKGVALNLGLDNEGSLLPIDISIEEARDGEEFHQVRVQKNINYSNFNISENLILVLGVPDID